MGLLPPCEAPWAPDQALLKLGAMETQNSGKVMRSTWPMHKDTGSKLDAVAEYLSLKQTLSIAVYSFPNKVVLKSRLLAFNLDVQGEGWTAAELVEKLLKA